jgi:enoyl-[acyl-carrier protein] reductase I
MPAKKPQWKPNEALPVGKGASIQQFIATAGDVRLEIDVARWGEGRLRANGTEIASTNSASDARQAFRELKKKAEQYLENRLADRQPNQSSAAK